MTRFGPSLFIFLAGLGFWVPGRLSLLRARHSLADAQAQLADLQDRIVADESRLASAREDRKRQNEARSQAVGELAGAQSELAKIDPEGQWANPPASLPDWHTDSPYSWRTKE